LTGVCEWHNVNTFFAIVIYGRPQADVCSSLAGCNRIILL
jgi:hypothetical protein